MKIVSLDQAETDGVKSITGVLAGANGDRRVLSVTSQSSNYAEIEQACEDFAAGEISSDYMAEVLLAAVNNAEKVANKIVKISDVLDGRMTFDGSHVMVDYEPIDPVLEAHILRLLDEDKSPRDLANWRAFARFIENLMSNPSEHSRTQFFAWLNTMNLSGHGFTLTDDGCFIGYKGCAVGPNNTPVSINHGPAIVDGVRMNGAIPNKIGSVIEMPRNSVQADPSVGCSQGLHVGTHGYAKNFAQGILLTVKVNPRDVVSVPTDCQAQKVRACRYEVLEITEGVNTTVLWRPKDDGINFDNGIVPGDLMDETITIRYQKANGFDETEYTLTVDNVDGEHLSGELTDGSGYRTFLVRKIVKIVAGNEDVEDDDDLDTDYDDSDDYDSDDYDVDADTTDYEDDDEDDTDDSEDVDTSDWVGKKVTFRYRKVNGAVKVYTVDVDEVGRLVRGTDEYGDYKSFKADNIEEVLSVDGKDDSDSTQDADIKAGDVIEFDYARVDGIVKHYVATVSLVDDRYIIAKDADGTKTFVKTRVQGKITVR